MQHTVKTKCKPMGKHGHINLKKSFSWRGGGAEEEGERERNKGR